jgi:hypothetical protein
VNATAREKLADALFAPQLDGETRLELAAQLRELVQIELVQPVTAMK